MVYEVMFVEVFNLILKQKKTMKKVVDVKTSGSFVLYKQQIDVDFYILIYSSGFILEYL